MRHTIDAKLSQPATGTTLERASQSQTPQLYSAQLRVVTSPLPSVSVVVPETSEYRPAEASPLRSDNGPIRISTVSQAAHATHASSARSVSSQKKSLDRRSVADPRNGEKQAQNAGPAPTGSNLRPVSAANLEDGSSVATRPIDPSFTTFTKGGGPSAKRRKISTNGHHDVSTMSDVHGVDPNVVLPSTETGDAVQEPAAGDMEARPSKQRAKRKPRMTVAEKRKQQEEQKATATSKDGAASTRKLRKEKRVVTDSNHQGDDREVEHAGQEDQEELGQNAAATTTKKSRRVPKARRKDTIEEAAAAVVEDALGGTSKDRKARGRRSKRKETPDEAQHVRIDIAETKMSDLCKDGGTGQKSSADKTIRESERAAALKKKQQEVQQMMGQADESIPQAAGAGESRIDRLDRERRDLEEQGANIVPQQHIVNGEIVIDTSSLRIDRHAIAEVERNAEQLEYVEEDEYTRKVNSGLGVKRDRSGGWNVGLVDLFYDGLRMFGTDFGMISKMFPGKTRHSVKLKFCREEKENGARIRATLLGEVLPVELEEFQKLTGEQYDDPSVLEKDIEEDKKKLEEEQEQEKQAIEAAKKERAEQAEAERVAAQGEESSSKENRRQRKKKSRKGRKGKERAEKAEKPPRRTKARRASALEGIGDNSIQQSTAET